MKRDLKYPKNSASKPYMPTPEQYAVSAEVKVGSAKGPWARVLAVIGWVLLAGLLAVLLYIGFLIHTVAKISTKPFNLQGLVQDEAGRTNVLVLGVGDPGHSGEKLSDALMVLSLKPSTRQVAQISLPRDLRVAIPGYGTAKINAAHAVGGVELASQTVSDTLGVPIPYYVRTNFSGLKQLVDAVGGIDVDVRERLRDTEYPCEENQYKVCGLDIAAGLQHMDGSRALQYVRCRKGTCGNDYGRAARQQEVLNLVKDKLVGWDMVLNPGKLSMVVKSLQAGLQTNMSAIEMVQFGLGWQAAKANEPVTLVLSTDKAGGLRNAPGSSDLVPVGGDFTVIQERVRDIFVH